MHQDDYELFRRAIVERDVDAWAAIAGRYRQLLISWVVRCPGADHLGESYEDLADEALARAWRALSPEHFAAFPSLAALLAYLRRCVSYDRHRRRPCPRSQ
jgi:DNA-directed RNA polymerase specialized sigma24 family protein